MAEKKTILFQGELEFSQEQEVEKVSQAKEGTDNTQEQPRSWKEHVRDSVIHRGRMPRRRRR